MSAQEQRDELAYALSESISRIEAAVARLEAKLQEVLRLVRDGDDA